MKLTGLTFQQVQQSRAKHGTKMLTLPPRIPCWQELLSKFKDSVIRILIVAALISFGVALLEKHISIESIVVAVLLATGFAFSPFGRSAKPTPSSSCSTPHSMKCRSS